MGIFSKLLGLDRARPLSLERVASCFKDLEYSVGQEDGTLFGSWPSFRAQFGVKGAHNEVLTMGSAWNIRPPLESYDALCLAANEWSSRNLWPNVNVFRGEMLCRVDADLAFDLEPAVTDAFIKQQIKCFLGTAEEAYTWFAQSFPDHVLWHDVRAE